MQWRNSSQCFHAIAINCGFRSIRYKQIYAASFVLLGLNITWTARGQILIFCLVGAQALDRIVDQVSGQVSSKILDLHQIINHKDVQRIDLPSFGAGSYLSI